jgi:hypothetical protein
MIPALTPQWLSTESEKIALFHLKLVASPIIEKYKKILKGVDTPHPDPLLLVL